jgi:hypothetical protein
MPWRPDRFGCDIRLSCIGRDALSGTAELITDAEKYKKIVRIGAVATTVLYEGLYTMREAQRRRPAGREACRLPATVSKLVPSLVTRLHSKHKGAV